MHLRDLAAKGLGEKKVQWRLRDWGISRQRYWGCPIPIIHCDTCGSVPVPDDQLPVKLPEDCVPDGSGNPLLKRADFINCTCPQCGKPAGARPTRWILSWIRAGTMHATPAGFKSDAMVDEETSYWMPVDQYIGGIEHAILHSALFALLDKVMRQPRSGQIRRAIRQPADPGHGAQSYLLAPHRQGWHRILRAGRSGNYPRRSRKSAGAKRLPMVSRWISRAWAPCRNPSATVSIRRH